MVMLLRTTELLSQIHLVYFVSIIAVKKEDSSITVIQKSVVIYADNSYFHTDVVECCNKSWKCRKSLPGL